MFNSPRYQKLRKELEEKIKNRSSEEQKRNDENAKQVLKELQDQFSKLNPETEKNWLTSQKMQKN